MCAIRTLIATAGVTAASGLLLSGVLRTGEEVDSTNWVEAYA
jgi:hypothetical protein